MDLITIVEWCNKNGVSTENAKDMGGHATKICKANRIEMSFIPVCNLPYDKVNTYPEHVLDNLFKNLVPKLKPQDIEIGFSLEEEPVDDSTEDQKHKHCDLIIAWANGAKIEFFEYDGWYDCTDGPSWDEDTQYRVKPKRVKREGWIGIYDDSISSGSIYRTQKECESSCPSACTTIRIEWEEWE